MFFSSERPINMMNCFISHDTLRRIGFSPWNLTVQGGIAHSDRQDIRYHADFLTSLKELHLKKGQSIDLGMKDLT